MLRINLASLLAVIATFIAILFAVPTASAHNAGGSPPAGPKSGVAWTDSGWVEKTFDSQGHLLGTRQGNGQQQPFAGKMSAADKGEGVAHTPDTQLLNSKRSLSRAADVSGCRQVDWYESGHSLLGALIYRFHQVKYWCWSYPSITYTNVYTYVSNVDASQQYRGVIGASDYYYTWSGSSRGGHYSFRQAKFDNCILKYGCVGSSYPWTKIWANGNGAWTASDGGGA